MSTYEAQKSTWRTKIGLAEMLKGGVIMDVACVEHAVIAEEAGAVAVMALERVPSDIRKQGGEKKSRPKAASKNGNGGGQPASPPASAETKPATPTRQHRFNLPV